MFRKLISLFLLATLPVYGAEFKDGTLIEQTASTATAAGTTTLTVSSARHQVFTGSTTQTVVLPDATTLTDGHPFNIVNASTGVVTVQYDDTTTAVTLNGGDGAFLILTDNGTSNGTWTIWDPPSEINNADIGSSAAIARTKLATGTADYVVIHDGSGNLSEEQYLDKTRGGAGADMSSVTFPSSGTIVTEAGTQTLTNKTLTSPVLNTGVSGTAVLDEDDLSSDSATQLATQQSIKAYVDTQVVSGAPEHTTDFLNLGVATSVGSSALTIALKQNDGSTDPSTGSGAVKGAFRSATATTGSMTVRSVTSSLSLTISSGSTMGFSSGGTHYLYFYLLDNAGTLKMCASGVILDEGKLHTSVAEGGAGGADSISDLVCDAVYSSKAVRMVARGLFTLTTAGTWDEAGDEISIIPFQEQPVVAWYSHSTTMSVNATNRFYPDTKVIDTHNAVTTGSGTWVFTCPKSAYYDVTVQIYHAASPGTTMTPYLRGTSSNNANYFGDTGIANEANHGTILTYCAAGETIWVDNATGSTTSLASISSSNWINISEKNGANEQ